MFGMDSFEFNKFAGALLGSLLFVMALSLVADVIFSQPKPAIGYALATAEPAAANPPAGSAAAAAEPLPVLLAKADPKKGEAAAKACAACHSFDKGGPNKVGPGLYGIVGHAKAAHEGFKYSAALQERGAKGESWGFDELDKFIANPKGYVPGTAMGYAGLKEPDRRADLLAYLRTLADTPVALPKP